MEGLKFFIGVEKFQGGGGGGGGLRNFRVVEKFQGMFKKFQGVTIFQEGLENYAVELRAETFSGK